jgi:hypothetical protein
VDQSVRVTTNQHTPVCKSLPGREGQRFGALCSRASPHCAWRRGRLSQGRRAHGSQRDSRVSGSDLWPSHPTVSSPFIKILYSTGVRSTHTAARHLSHESLHLWLHESVNFAISSYTTLTMESQLIPRILCYTTYILNSACLRL